MLCERVDQPRVVALVQAHRRLVEHVEQPLHAGADLGGEPQAVGLAAGEGRGRAVERQIAEPQREQHVEPREDLADHPLADVALALAEGEPGERLAGARERQAHDVRDREAGETHGQALGAQPRAAAGAARLLA